MASVTWSIGPGSSRALRVLWYAGVAVWSGFVLLSVGLAAAVAIGGLLAGNPGPALLVGLFVLVGGPLSVVYLWPMLADADQRPAFLSPPAWMAARWLVLGSVVVAAFVTTVPAAAIGLFPFGIASGVVVAVLQSEGELHPGSGRLTVNGRAVDLGDVDGVSRLALGRLAVCWLRYPRDAGTATAPRLVVLPAAVADQVSEAVDARATVSQTATTTRRSSRTVQAVLLVAGLCSLGVGAALHLLDPLPPAVAIWGSGLFGLVGVLFLWLAYQEA